MMYKCNISQLPNPKSELFSVTSNVHRHNTRLGSYLHTPPCRCEATYHTFSYRGSHNYMESYFTTSKNKCLLFINLNILPNLFH